MKSLIIALSVLAAMLAGCSSVENSGLDIGGVYTMGIITNNSTGKSGYLKPYIEVDTVNSRITVEDFGSTWSSEYVRDGDAIIIKTPGKDFPSKLSVKIEKKTQLPMLYTTKGSFFSSVSTGYGMRKDFPRKVGKPVPVKVEVVLNSKVELTNEQRRVLNRIGKDYFFRGSCEFLKITSIDKNGDEKTVIDIPGKITVTEQDPADISIFGDFSVTDMKLKDADGTICIYGKKP